MANTKIDTYHCLARWESSLFARSTCRVTIKASMNATNACSPRFTMICLNRKALSREVDRAWKYIDLYVKWNHLNVVHCVWLCVCVCVPRPPAMYIQGQDRIHHLRCIMSDLLVWLARGFSSKYRCFWVNFLSLCHVTTASTNDNRRNICNVFSKWLRLVSRSDIVDRGSALVHLRIRMKYIYALKTFSRPTAGNSHSDNNTLYMHLHWYYRGGVFHNTWLAPLVSFPLISCACRQSVPNSMLWFALEIGWQTMLKAGTRCNIKMVY